MILALVLAALSLGVDQGRAQSPIPDDPATPAGASQTECKMRCVTPEQRESAAARAAAVRQSYQSEGVSQPLAAPTPGGMPDYFGIYPNYANSPLPTGPVDSITVTSRGSGYSAHPTVTITDITGIGATAKATVLNGRIAGITVTKRGSGYTNPVVTVTDISGTGAAATARIAWSTLTSGIKKFKDALPGLGYANRNNIGQYIPVAVPDTTTYPGSDYYEIG